MAEKTTKRFKLPFPTGKGKVSEGATNFEELAETLDEVNAGQQDYLQAGVAGAEDWSFSAIINSSTGELGSLGEAEGAKSPGGIAWCPDPEESSRLMRTETEPAKLEKLKASTLPATGKYMTIGFELTASSWGAAATISLKSGSEYSTQAEAEAHPPAVTSGKIRIRDVVVRNASAVYSIVAQEDRRVYALNGARLAEESVTGAKLGEGTIRQETGSKQSYMSWALWQREEKEKGTILAGSGDLQVNHLTATTEVVFESEKANTNYGVLFIPQTEVGDEFSPYVVERTLTKCRISNVGSAPLSFTVLIIILAES